MRSLISFFSGWPDFLMTIIEALLPHFGMYRLARYVAEKHYAGGLHGPGAKESVFARIYEIAGDNNRAEEYYDRATELRPTFADYQMFFGAFLARQRRTTAAIAAFERAHTLSPDQATRASIDATIANLRHQSPR
jgi:tetratricopeptide (TPR) repeat protein